MNVAFALVLTACAQNASTPGAASSPYPTIENLAVDWPVSGDANNNGVVTVRYRVQGSVPWSTGMPLMHVLAGTNQGFSWAHRHSGSVMGLQPATIYEIELTLTDPDGGSTTTTVTATTRAVPQAAAGGTVVPVTPGTFAAAAGAAVAGDILSLAPGAYAGFTFTKNGTLALPIVIRSATPGAAVINGDVRLDGRSYVFLEDCTVNGMVKFNGATGLAIRGNTITAPSTGGIIAYSPNGVAAGATNCFIADNALFGPYAWLDANLGANGATTAEGIEFTGPGNVICYNRVRGFRDGISFMEDASAVNQVCNDVHHNDIEVGCDDGIEADFAMGNCRIYRNRMTNCFVGLSSQPSLGGPTYFLRNEMYNCVYSPFKLHRGSIGDVAYHNTAVKCGDALGIYAGATWSRAIFRNNLFLGGQGGGTFGGFGNGTGDVARMADADATCSFDYDGFGSIGTGAFAGRIGATSFSSLAQLKAATTEVHAVQVDLSVFAAPPPFPDPCLTERAKADLRLAAASPAINAGVAIPNVNDGFAGGAPDLGAYEFGSAAESFGPRTGAGSGGPPGGGGGSGGGGGGGGCGLVGLEALILLAWRRRGR